MSEGEKKGAATGRRERNRLETRMRLTRAAQRLFAEKGFDATTVDEIAEAAGVSRRTFFHYFASKEDVIFSRHADFEATLLQTVRDAPADEPLLETAERAVVAALGHFDRDEAMLIERLKRETPALRGRDVGKYERLERALGEVLAERMGIAPDAVEARLGAMMITGTLRVAGATLIRDRRDDEEPDDYARRVFGMLREGLRE